MKLARLKNSSGFSLIEILMAMGMAGVVGLGAAYVVQSQVLTQRDVTSRMDLSAAHSLALQKARNLQFVSDHVVLAAIPNRTVAGADTAAVDASRIEDSASAATPAPVPEIRDPRLDRCLAGKPKSLDACGQLDRPKIDLPSVVRDDPNGPIKSELFATRTCGALGCSKITVTVTTRRMMNKNAQGASFTASGYESGDMKEAGKLESMVEFPGLAFLTNEQMDFNCATGATLTGLSMGDRVGTCSPAVSAALMTCSGGNGAMLGFGLTQACTQLRSNACVGAISQAGVSKIGRAVSSVDCGDIIPLTTPPTPVPPATATPATGGCWSTSSYGPVGRAITGPNRCVTFGACPTIGAQTGVTKCMEVPTGATQPYTQNDLDAATLETGYRLQCRPVSENNCTVSPSAPAATATPGACAWTQTNDDPAGCNTPNNNRLFLTLNGASSSIGYTSLAQAIANLPSTARDGDTASYCGTCTMFACRVTEWSCMGTTPSVPPATPAPPAPPATPTPSASTCAWKNNSIASNSRSNYHGIAAILKIAFPQARACTVNDVCDLHKSDEGRDCVAMG
ncbi:MAG: type II secretion system protein, partial [Proteobacteria bacterium]